MIAAGDHCADCGELLDVNVRVFRAAAGVGLRCAKCDSNAQLRSTCARPDGCDVRTLCQTISCCATRNPGVVLELAKRIGAEPAGTAIVARRRAS